MKIVIALAFLSTFSAHGACKYMIENKDLKIEWTGFKTMKKVGVTGTFKKYKLSNFNSSSDLKKSIAGSTVEIDGSSVFSKDKVRDSKLAKNIFSTLLGGSKIMATVDSINDNFLNVKFTLNGKSLNSSMKYTVKNNVLVASGSIDMLSFSMDRQHAAISKACSLKHEKKTWTDVDLKLTANFTCK